MLNRNKYSTEMSPPKPSETSSCKRKCYETPSETQDRSPKKFAKLDDNLSITLMPESESVELFTIEDISPRLDRPIYPQGNGGQKSCVDNNIQEQCYSNSDYQVLQLYELSDNPSAVLPNSGASGFLSCSPTSTSGNASGPEILLDLQHDSRADTKQIDVCDVHCQLDGSETQMCSPCQTSELCSDETNIVEVSERHQNGSESPTINQTITDFNPINHLSNVNEVQDNPSLPEELRIFLQSNPEDSLHWDQILSIINCPLNENDDETMGEIIVRVLDYVYSYIKPRKDGMPSHDYAFSDIDVDAVLSNFDDMRSDSVINNRTLDMHTRLHLACLRMNTWWNRLNLPDHTSPDYAIIAEIYRRISSSDDYFNLIDCCSRFNLRGPRKKLQKLIVSDNLVQSEEICPICFDCYSWGEMICELCCEHHFHFSCIEKWYEKRDQCPVCRQCIGCEPNEDDVNG